MNREKDITDDASSGCDILLEFVKTFQKPMKLKEMLTTVLNRLEEVPWLSVENRGAILLVGSSGDLIMVASHDLSEDRTAHCERVPMDRCACGEAVKRGESIFDICEGEGIFSQSTVGKNLDHFVLPLIDYNRVLGVIPIFTPPGHKPDAGEIKFMSDLALILSSVISRKFAEEVVMVKNLELMETKSEVIHKLGIASEYRDPETGTHILRMSHYAGAIARAAGLSDEDRESLMVVAPMHDVGKIGIPDSILRKNGKLDTEEFDTMKNHTLIGERILNGEEELMKLARSVAVSHHEKWDGTGYPRGLKGEEIPIFGRICGLADVFDALTSERPYKKAWAVEKSLEVIEKESGRSFDPKLVASLKKALPEILRLKELYREDIIDPREKLTLPPLERPDNVWINWDDTLSVGIDVIDEHHMYLIDIINELYRVVNDQEGSREVGRLLRSVEFYASIHFREEERMMEKYGYSRIEKHRKQHSGFAEQTVKFRNEMVNYPMTLGHETVYFLRDWLIEHIKQEDIHLRELTVEV